MQMVWKFVEKDGKQEIINEKEATDEGIDNWFNIEDGVVTIDNISRAAKKVVKIPLLLVMKN